MSQRSIYESIAQNLTPDGRLPQAFSLTRKVAIPNELCFMPGAKDGIGLFHAGAENPEKIAAEIARRLKEMFREQKPSFIANLFAKGCNNQDAQEKVAALIRENGTLSVVDPVLNTIRKDHDGIDIQGLIYYACSLAFESDDEELVKFGIALLGLFDLSSEKEIVNKLCTLARYEEFTLFVVVALSNCANANARIFEIAQKVDGWGKIHAVERLQPETEEIKDWLIRKGCENSVMDAYLGLESAIKGDLISVLRKGTLDEALFEGTSIIINALLDEGPVDGISVYDHAGEALSLYLASALSHAVTVKHLWYVLNVQDWLEHNEIAGRDALKRICTEITGRSGWKERTQSILAMPDDSRFFFAANAARRLGIDTSSQLYEAVKAKPLEHYGYLSMLYKDPAYAKELTAMYEAILPLDKMEKGMGDYLFATTFGAEHSCLDFILQELGAYPNMGELIIRTALLSPVVRERHGATRALVAWCDALNKPLAEISLDLYSAVMDIVSAEVNAEIKERMETLLKDCV